MRAFLSSTYVDLVEHRRVAVDALERLGNDVARMEVFGARPEEPSEACFDEIDRSNIFIGVYAHRYGHVRDGSTTSITEDEFWHARRGGIPLFCFVVASDYAWPPGMVEGEPGRARLLDFKGRISDVVVRDAFRTPEDLGLKIATSVGRYLATRGVQVDTPIDSLAMLRDRAARLCCAEHVVDNIALPVTVFPSLMEVRQFPSNTVPTGPLVVWPGQWLEIRFSDVVLAMGIYYQQRLYSSTFAVYFRSGRHEIVGGVGWTPSTEFFGTISDDPIERVIIQSQAHGSVVLAGIYVFAGHQHARVL